MSGPDESFAAAHLRRLSATALEAAETLSPVVERYAAWVRATLAAGGRLLLCGNGGSAATAEHVAAEYAVRLRREREPLSALSLTGSAASLTAAANDYGFEQAFARAVRAQARSGDLLVLHSTSGRSANLLEAARAAARIPLRVVALLGAGGGELAEVADLVIRVPCEDVARVQEIHLAIEHAVVGAVEAWLGEGAA